MMTCSATLRHNAGEAAVDFDGEHFCSPRPEERSVRRRVSKDASAHANSATTGGFFETSLFRAPPQNEVCGRTAGTFFGRGRWRKFVLSSGVVALALIANLACARAQSLLGPSGADLGAERQTSAPLALEFTRGPLRRASSPQSPSDGLASFGRSMAREDQGGGSSGPTQQGSSDACDNLLGQRDLPPLGRSDERPSFDGLTPAPTRGGGCANAIDFVAMQLALSPDAPLNFGDVGEASPLLLVFDSTAIQRRGPSSLDRFASARDDGRGLGELSRRSGPRRGISRRRSSTTRPSGLRYRQCKARSGRRWNGSLRVMIAATHWARATRAPRAGRSRPSMPGRFDAPCGSAKTRPD